MQKEHTPFQLYVKLSFFSGFSVIRDVALKINFNFLSNYNNSVFYCRKLGA